MRLRGKVVLVTGAAGGIGHAVSTLFAKEGATVFASDLTPPKKPHADGVETLTLDVTSEAVWAETVDWVVGKSGRLDVLINNAGIIAYEPLHELGMEAWQRMIAVDQTGVFLGMREAVRIMRRQKSGSIVNISSIWGSAAVAGAHSLPRGQRRGAQHVEERGHDLCRRRHSRELRASGLIHTPLTDAQAADLNETVIASTRMKRGGQPLEIAYGCLFLASDEASYVTGAELVIDGGYLAQ